MTREEVYERLIPVFQDVFDDSNLVVGDSTTANDIECWDSLEHIHLVLAVESEFEVNFAMADTLKMKNVGAMVDLILELSQ